MSKAAMFAFLSAALLIGAAVAFRLLRGSPELVNPAPLAPEPQQVRDAPAAPVANPLAIASVATHPAPQPVAQTNTRVASSSPPSSDPAARGRELAAELVALSGTGGPITAEQAAKFKQDLAELIHGGASSVPAIREFLDKHLDASFAGISGADQLGYSSLRAGLLDALKQIGGPEARDAMVSALQTSAVPSELLELARDIEQLAPGQYRDQIMAATRETLSMGAANQLGTNIELGPAFRLQQLYGNANSIDDVARNNPAGFRDAVAMANMPDGQGLPSLVQMAQNPGNSQTIATEMIAQLASQNDQARDALTQMAQNGQIPNNVWVRLAPILGGDQYQIASGGQSYSVVDGATSPDQIYQRIALIDKLLGFVSDGSSAANALQQERGILSGKLGK